MSSVIYTVSALVHYIKSTLDNDMNLQAVFIKGEISNFTNHRSGHWYFTLKDAKSRISCVMFNRYASQCPILLKEGMKVIITASVSVYEAAGSTQLYVSKVQVDGIGDLYLQFEQIKERLFKEGLFADSHKLSLPPYPMSIALISAKEGAALQDMLTTITKRWPLADVVLYPCLVQGTMASKQIIEALGKADQQNHDVMILARGGGSLEDLWCFNDETLARTIYHLQTPIVSGVGHETDTTLVDYVSDVRAATPTAAAQIATPDMHELIHALNQYQARMLQAMRVIDKHARQQLLQVKQNQYLKDPMRLVENANLQLAMHIKSLSEVENRVERVSHQLQSIVQHLAHDAAMLIQKNNTILQTISKQNQDDMLHLIQKKRDLLTHQAIVLDAFSPLKILTRGYSIIRKEEIIKSVKQLHEHDQVSIRFSDGHAQAKIIELKEDVHE